MYIIIEINSDGTTCSVPNTEGKRKMCQWCITNETIDSCLLFQQNLGSREGLVQRCIQCKQKPVAMVPKPMSEPEAFNFGSFEINEGPEK